MVERTGPATSVPPAAQLDAVFHALSDSTRRAMLGRLGHGAFSVGELAAPFDMSLAAASKHIQTLERAGLIDRQVQGRTHLCRLRAQPLAEAQQWLQAYEGFWTQSFDRLSRLLAEQDVGGERAQASHAKPKAPGRGDAGSEADAPAPRAPIAPRAPRGPRRGNVR